MGRAGDVFRPFEHFRSKRFAIAMAAIAGANRSRFAFRRFIESLLALTA
jgi:hypothetical protein